MLGWTTCDWTYSLVYGDLIIPAGTFLEYGYREYGSMILSITSPREYAGLVFTEGLDTIKPLVWQTVKPLATVPQNKHI